MIKEILHDCAGSGPISWLTMAYQHRNIPAPWEVYDATFNESQIVTVSNALRCTRRVRASALIKQLIANNDIPSYSIPNVVEPQQPMKNREKYSTVQIPQEPPTLAKSHVYKVGNGKMILLVTRSVIILLITLLMSSVGYIIMNKGSKKATSEIEDLNKLLISKNKEIKELKIDNDKFKLALSQLKAIVNTEKGDLSTTKKTSKGQKRASVPKTDTTVDKSKKKANNRNAPSLIENSKKNELNVDVTNKVFNNDKLSNSLDETKKNTNEIRETSKKAASKDNSLPQKAEGAENTKK